MIGKLAAASLVVLVAADQPRSDWPGDRVTDEMREIGVEMLKEAYRMNGNSMTGWYSIDIPKKYGPAIPPRDGDVTIQPKSR